MVLALNSPFTNMATVSVTYPRPVRRPVQSVAAGRSNPLEMHFSKIIDNRALVLKANPATGRELAGLAAACVLVFSVILLLMLLIKQSRQAGYSIERLKDQEAKAEIEEAEKFAKDSPYPTREEILQDVYVD